MTFAPGRQSGRELAGSHSPGGCGYGHCAAARPARLLADPGRQAQSSADRSRVAHAAPVSGLSRQSLPHRPDTGFRRFNGRDPSAKRLAAGLEDGCNTGWSEAPGAPPRLRHAGTRRRPAVQSELQLIETCIELLPEPGSPDPLRPGGCRATSIDDRHSCDRSRLTTSAYAFSTATIPAGSGIIRGADLPLTSRQTFDGFTS